MKFDSSASRQLPCYRTSFQKISTNVDLMRYQFIHDFHPALTSLARVNERLQKQKTTSDHFAPVKDQLRRAVPLPRGLKQTTLPYSLSSPSSLEPYTYNQLATSLPCSHHTRLLPESLSISHTQKLPTNPSTTTLLLAPQYT